jgi:hypothetical protein
MPAHPPRPRLGCKAALSGSISTRQPRPALPIQLSEAGCATKPHSPRLAFRLNLRDSCCDATRPDPEMLNFYNRCRSSLMAHTSSVPRSVMRRFHRKCASYMASPRRSFPDTPIQVFEHSKNRSSTPMRYGGNKVDWASGGPRLVLVLGILSGYATMALLWQRPATIGSIRIRECSCSLRLRESTRWNRS